MSLEERLRSAAEAGDVVGIRSVLAEVAPEGVPAVVNCANEAGFDAATLAAMHGHMEALVCLVEAGADVSHTAATHSAIRGAALHAHDAVITYLLEHRACIDCLSLGNRTPIMGAAMNGHVSTVQLLLKHGADTTLRNSYGETAKDLAKEEAIKQLL